MFFTLLIVDRETQIQVKTITLTNQISMIKEGETNGRKKKKKN
jgi:hypothetical protein